ncbi:MAG TPA: hypothetical protein VET27_01675 [Mycobacterium sp.]|nr:hypothetical protein [Mycobacterium sp.]
MSPHTSTYWRRLAHATRLAAAGAIAAGAMMLTAPAGHAIPESTIISECNEAGGSYTTIVIDLKRYSTCCYRDISGVTHCDHYEDGTYTTTNNILEPPQTSPPPPPPDEVVGPPATAATPAPPDFGGPSMTLWMPPPPAGPAAPPPGEATLAP